MPPPAQWDIVVPIMGSEFHKQTVASELPMGYDFTSNEEAAGTAADAWEENER